MTRPDPDGAARPSENSQNTIDDAQHLTVLRAVLLVFLPFSGGYFLSYLFRSTNAVIAPQLVSEIGLSAGDLGLLTAVYFITFAAFQLPLGIMLDRFGPRRVQAAVLLLAALGAFLFSVGESFASLLLGRALIGFGVAGGLMASFKAITLWFEKDTWPLVNGCFMAIGGLGAVAATTPLEAALGVTDWRGVFAGLALATCAVSIAIFVIVPERRAGIATGGIADQLYGLKVIYRDRLFWRLAPVTVTTLAANLAIQGLWAGPWLRDVGGFDREQVAQGLFILTAAMTVGFVLVGMSPGLAAKKGWSINTVFGGGVVIFILAQLVITLGFLPQAMMPWVAFGLASNISILAYAQISRHFPLSYVGRANTALNLLSFGFVFVVQYGIGAVIDLYPAMEGGTYLPEAYRAAFGVFVALQVVSLLWFWQSRGWAQRGAPPVER